MSVRCIQVTMHPISSLFGKSRDMGRLPTHHQTRDLKRDAGMVKCQDWGGSQKSKQWQELTNFVFGFVYVQASTLSHGSSINSVWSFELAIKKTSRPNKAITSVGDAILNISVSAPRLWQPKLHFSIWQLSFIFGCQNAHVHIHHPLMLPSLQETLWNNYRSKLSEFKANQRTVLPGIAWEVPLPLVATRRLSKSSLDCCIKEWSWEEIYTKGPTLVPRPTVNTLSGVIQTTKSGCLFLIIFYVPVMGVGVTRRTLPSTPPWGPHIWAVKASDA